MRRFTNDCGVIRYWGTGKDDLIIMHAFPRKAPDLIAPEGLNKISLRARHYTPGRVLTLNTYVTLFYAGNRPKNKWITAELMKLENLYPLRYLRKYDDVEHAMLMDIRDEDSELYSSEAAYYYMHNTAYEYCVSNVRGVEDVDDAMRRMDKHLQDSERT